MNVAPLSSPTVSPTSSNTASTSTSQANVPTTVTTTVRSAWTSISPTSADTASTTAPRVPRSPRIRQTPRMRQQTWANHISRETSNLQNNFDIMKEDLNHIVNGWPRSFVGWRWNDDHEIRSDPTTTTTTKVVQQAWIDWDDLLKRIKEELGFDSQNGVNIGGVSITNHTFAVTDVSGLGVSYTVGKFDGICGMSGIPFPWTEFGRQCEVRWMLVRSLSSPSTLTIWLFQCAHDTGAQTWRPRATGMLIWTA